ncbi:hypothetical protein [Thermaurantiacus sp.]
MPDSGRFTRTWGPGNARTSRFCPQAAMPEPFRSDDLSDLPR